MAAWDRALFFWINRWPDGLNPIMQFFSKGINHPAMKIFLALILIGLLARSNTRKAGLVAGLGWLVANEVTDLWKLIPFGRPGNELSDAIVRVGMSNSMGTASAHSANMAFVAFVFVWYFRQWGSPWIAVAVLTGISRIYVGAHYPSQVLLGWTTGCLCAWGVCVAVDHFTRPAKGDLSNVGTAPNEPGSGEEGLILPDGKV